MILLKISLDDYGSRIMLKDSCVRILVTASFVRILCVSLCVSRDFLTPFRKSRDFESIL